MTQTERRKRRRRILIAGAAVLILIVVGGLVSASRSKGEVDPSKLAAVVSAMRRWASCR